MNHDRKISLKKNFIMNALLAMSSFIFPMITFPYVSRVLLPAGTGRVSFATSLISYFNLFAQLGIPTYGVRLCARVRDDREELTRVAHELLTINVVMSIFAYAALAAALIFVPALQDDRLLYVITSSTILMSAIGMEWLYRGLEQYTYITVRSVVFKLIALIAMFLLIHRESDYVIYGAISVFASSASSVLNLINARKYISLRRPAGLNCRRHLKAIGVFFAMSCATTVYTHLDVVMLKLMTTNADTGYYNAAVKVKTILVSIVTSLGTVLLPRSSYYVEHGEMREFRKVSGKALNFVMLFAVPVTVYFMYFAREGILFISGTAYENSVRPMRIIMPTVVLIGLTNILGMQILVPLGREKIVLYSVTAGAVVDLVINALLIPSMKSSGAAAGTLAAEAAVLVWQGAVLKDEVKGEFASIHYLRLAAAVGLSLLASFWVPRVLPSVTSAQCFLVLAVSAVLYFGVYVLYMVLRKEPLALEILDTVLRRFGRRKKPVS